LAQGATGAVSGLHEADIVATVGAEMAPYSTVVPALIGVATASSIQNAVTPVDKVITLMQELKAECEAEASAEAVTYDTFACFCKDTTDAKSMSIQNGADTIAEDSADLAANVASKEEKEEELQTRKKKQEELSTELAETKSRCQKEEAEYDAEAADLNKGISSLEKAIAAMEAGKPMLLELGSSVKKTLAMADALNLIETKKQQKVAAFLQVDPNDPEYKHHSQGIIDILNQALSEFQANKADLDAEWTKTDTNCQSTISDLTSQMTENSNAMDLCEETIAELTTDIADIREDIVGAQAALEDNKVYMKDLTERCEARAKDYDQRSAMRGQEIDALTKALAILVDEVKGKSDSANERALLQKPSQWKQFAEQKSAVSDVAESLSFLQQSSSVTARNLAKTFLQRSQTGALSENARRERVLVLLKTEGQRLSSTALSSLAMKVSADPFLKVKKLIQQLIERLLSEAAAEATKKGFCDNELSKARKDRDFRFAEVKKLSSDIRSLNAKKAELETELEQLAQALKDLDANLAEATKIRGEEKEENLQTMKDARQGLTALTQAIQILKIFYKQAAKAKTFIQASPLEEDDPGAAKGAYKGNQGASKAILGLLEVLQSDFQRTLSTTEAAEKKAQAEFVEFDRTSKADIGAKQTKTELDTEDLSKTEINIEKSMKSLQENQDAVDQSVKELEELKPMCIDSGMSYEERVEKREEEIAALKKAVCELDTEGVEPDC